MTAKSEKMTVVRIAVTMIGAHGAAEAVPVPVLHDRPTRRWLRLGRLWTRHRLQPRRTAGECP
jgi:hypothetical protein